VRNALPGTARRVNVWGNKGNAMAIDARAALLVVTLLGTVLVAFGIW
jgi:hypothetical protein